WFGIVPLDAPESCRVRRHREVAAGGMNPGSSSSAPSAPDYLNPGIPSGMRRHPIPIVRATNESLEGYGCLVEDPSSFEIEIVRWPAQGWRPVDPDCGDEGGTTSGEFISTWTGDVLYGRNGAVGGHYIIGYGTDPGEAREDHDRDPSRLLLWHANYHPDGGQLFVPQDGRPFVCPLALPGDDRTPSDFVCFLCDGTTGLYIHPNIWHEGVFALKGEQRFHDTQGAVHARVSMDFPREFECLLEVDLSSI
ncbi:MAG: ureidoglycolate lyase, partial [Phycisphaerales bacterium]|nr:ureidoglycolate lyase [Phycisphaerales bacterium]